MYTVASNSQTGNFRFFSINPNLLYENQVQRNITVRLSDAHNITVRYVIHCCVFKYLLYLWLI